jgi:hypothetical protein
VVAAQDAYRQGVESIADNNGVPRNWSEATVQIQRYNDFCLATGMRALVEEAVGKADVYFDPDRKDVEVMNTSAAEIRRAIETVRQQQRLYHELSSQEDIAQKERKLLQTGLTERDQAKGLLKALEGNPFYSAANKTVDIAGADAKRDLARAALDAALLAGNSNPALKRAYDEAAREAHEARDIERALKIDDIYNAAWEKARNDAIARAEAQIKEIDDRLKPPPAPGPKPEPKK